MQIKRIKCATGAAQTVNGVLQIKKINRKHYINFNIFKNNHEF